MKRRPIDKEAVWNGSVATTDPFSLTVTEVRILLYALENIQPFDWCRDNAPEALTDDEEATLDGLIGKVMGLADG